MKNHMIGFYRPSDDEFKGIWDKATFVLDANVLLNLYRYPAKASQELLGALAKLSDRLWLPYHAALEYQRNRLGIIAEQKKRFADVRKLIEDTTTSLTSQFSKLQLKKRHSSIDVEEFLLGLENLTKVFLGKLGNLEENQRNVSDEDQMRNAIDTVLLGKIGPLTFDQNRLNDIYKQGELRYAIEMPPGYMDQNKEKHSKPDSYQYGGLIYKKKFGDLILWQQIIEYAKEKAIKCLVLLTDDEKNDWWWTVDSQGEKRIGPKPELVEEINREGKVDFFYMYNSEQFLQFSKQYLKADVSDESINQVREIRLTSTSRLSFADMQRFAFTAEEAVFEWLQSRYPSSQIMPNRIGFPDFIVCEEHNHKIGFEVKVLRDPRILLMRLRDTAYRAYYEINEGSLDNFFIVLVMENAEMMEEALKIYHRQKNLPSNVGIIFGILETREEDSRMVFLPVKWFRNDINIGETLAIDDTITSALYRICEKCGSRFEVHENERACPSCASE